MIDSASWAQRLGGDTFLAQTCFRAHAVIRSAGTAVPTLLTWDDINEIVAAHRLEPPRMRLSRAGEAVPATAYSVLRTNRRGVSWYQPQPAEFHARLAEGASLVIDAIDQIHPPVRAAATGLERFFRTPVQANAYASWTSEEGFGTHWDDHDVVVLQLEGSKRWKIYGPTRQAPAWRDVEAPEAPTGDPIADIVLTPGDLLYLPRGWWHAVSADQGTASLHLTFGLASRPVPSSSDGCATTSGPAQPSAPTSLASAPPKRGRTTWVPYARRCWPLWRTQRFWTGGRGRWTPHTRGTRAFPCRTWRPYRPSPGSPSRSPCPAPGWTRTPRR